MPLPTRSSLFDKLALSAFGVASLLFVGAMTLTPRDPDNGVAVVFAPWTGASETFSRAVESGGRFVRFGGFSFIAVVVPESHGYAGAVRRNGAWLLADPKLLAACLRPVTGAGV